MRVFLSSHGASLFGAERVLLEIARGLVERGHYVTLELPHEGPALNAARRIDGLEVWLSRRPRLPRNARELIVYIAGFAVSVRRLRDTIRSGRYNVVWVNSIYNPVAARAARRTGAAVVWHLHERSLRGVVGRLAAKWISAHCDVAIAPSRFVADSMTSVGLSRAKLRVVPNALLQSVERMPLRPRAGAFVVGYLGQLERHKHVVHVLQAVAQLAGSQALLIGEGKARPAIEKAVNDLGLAGRARLVGFQDDIQPHLAACDCLAIPSPNEAFGLVALEAMASGRPVVAARSGALSEVLGDAALYYDFGDVAQLTACLRRLRDAPALAEDLRTRGFARVEEYSRQKLIDSSDAIVHEVAVLRQQPHAAEVRV